MPSDFRDKLAEPISEEEIIQAIDKLGKGKSPGDDGITIDFYKRFQKLLAPHLLLVYQDSYKEGSLPNTSRNSIICLLHKKNDKTDMKNYRPKSEKY